MVYYTLFDLLYYTGLRLSEALALNWSDLQNGYISVTKTLLKSSIDIPMFNPPKTQASIRKIKIDNNVLDNLNKLHSYYQSFINFNDNWFIFGGIKPLSRTTIERKKIIIVISQM